MKSDFETISQKWSPYWDHVSRAPIGSLPWRSRSQHYLASNLCPANNFVIWSRILKLFHRNDRHIETMCLAQHLGRYLEGQGHSMTLQQNQVRSITLLFEVGFYNYFWQTTSLCPIPIRGALPGSDRSCLDCIYAVRKGSVRRTQKSCYVVRRHQILLFKCAIFIRKHNNVTFKVKRKFENWR